MVHFSFNILKVEKLSINIYPNNLSSRKVAFNNGFKVEGLLICEFGTGSGELIDVTQFELVLGKK